MSRYEELIEKIKANRYSEQDLINLYKNADERDELEVLEAIRLQMRATFPRAANRIFGAKQTDVQAKLDNVLMSLSEKFDVSKNRVGGRVKAGGEMLSGKRYLDQYISYKSASQDAVRLALTQEEVDSELVVTVTRYKTGQGSFQTEKTFKMDDFSLAVAGYEEYIASIISSP